jgi:dCTP deaminase
MLTDAEIKEALDAGLLSIDPFEDGCLQGASYDLRVGGQAFISGDEAIVDISTKGLVIIDPGEFAVLSTREKVHCGPQIAGQIGLGSTFARQGLTLLSGPQIDPGFDGVLVVRVTNLSPNRVTLMYETPFLTAQFFKLNRPVERPYRGKRQGQVGITETDVEALINSESQTIGGMVRSLANLARDVGELKTSVKWMGFAIPIIVGLGIAVIGIIVSLQ